MTQLLTAQSNIAEGFSTKILSDDLLCELLPKVSSLESAEDGEYAFKTCSQVIEGFLLFIFLYSYSCFFYCYSSCEMFWKN